MTDRRFRKGDVVRFQLPLRKVEGVVVEDRGPIGVKGRRLYRVEFRFEAVSPSLSHVELPAEKLELVTEAAATE